MPEFEATVDVDYDEYWDSCSNREKEKLIEYIIEDGYSFTQEKEDRKKNILDLEWDKVCETLQNSRLNITLEEEETIKNIAKKYERFF